MMRSLRRTGTRIGRNVLGTSKSSLLWWIALGVARLLARLTGSARWQLRVGEAHDRLGRRMAAVEAWEQAATFPDCQPASLLRRGDRERTRGRPTEALVLYRAGLRVESDHAGLRRRLVDTLKRLDRWEEVAELHRDAPGQLGDDPATQLSLAEALTRVGDREGAYQAYLHVLEKGRDAAAKRAARPALAALCHETGHWETARVRLEEHLTDHHRDAHAHRLLARVLHEMWTWNGWFEGSLQEPELTVFRSFGSPDGAQRALTRARDALDRAVDLEPDRPAWRGALGELQEAAGDVEAAIESYEETVAAVTGSSKRSSFKTLHRWEFALQRARHLAGRADVEDALFTCTARLEEGGPTAPARPIGFFRVAWNFAGFGISGFVTRSDVKKVEVLLGDTKLREVNMSAGTFFPGFGVSITRPAIEHLPVRSSLRVRTIDGEELLADGRAPALELTIPHGDGMIADLVSAGGGIDKKGDLSRPTIEVRERQTALLDLYVEAREAFERIAGRCLFLLYGTLLGCYRDGALIAGDDDFDVGYVSSEREPAAVKRETIDLVLDLVRAGYAVSFNRSGRLFRLHADPDATYGLHLDVHPVWFDDEGAWAHNQAHFDARVDDFLPACEASLMGSRVWLPKRPEVFLAGNYGPGWRVPDPGFVHNPGEVDPRVRSHLAKALITPPEYRRLAEVIEMERAQRPGMGRLVSIGSQPLYPLEDFVP